MTESNADPHEPIAGGIPYDKQGDPSPDHRPFSLMQDNELITETQRIKAALEMAPEGTETRQTLLTHFLAATMEIDFRKLPDPFGD